MSSLQITDVKVYPFDTTGAGGKIKAFAEVVFNDALLIKGLKVVQGTGGGLFVSFPTQRSREGHFHELVVPLDNSIREMIRKKVIEEYKKLE
ncbi:MAG: septation protein SpoVG family protein [Candidatus Tectomicrobia bacterium]|uniref:Septation protein SpoVG family protein n=1 Tax=Tectimicrobiota bacterium TaxID=2528274 RepID=A0A933GL14_UNCTE|nr:septation protein SpoVG family protein [Candidatus Tectomicrobia bacterium]